MCGIVGYIGKKSAVDILLEGLTSLEYRGYDSSGIAVNINGILTWVEQILNILLHFWYNLKGLFVITTGDFIPVHLLDPTYYLEEIPVVLPFNSVFVIVMGTLILSVVVSALPSIKAGSEKPLDTLRKI